MPHISVEGACLLISSTCFRHWDGISTSIKISYGTDGIQNTQPAGVKVHTQYQDASHHQVSETFLRLLN